MKIKAIILICINLFFTNNIFSKVPGRSLSKAVFIEDNFKSGYYFYNRRNYAASVSFFDKAISHKPDDYRSRIWLGQAYFMAGFLKNALTEWQTALNLGEGGNLLRNKLNYLYTVQGRDKNYSYGTPYIYLKTYKGYRQKKGYFIQPTGVVVDNANRMIIAGFKNGSVVIMDSNGKIKKTISAGIERPYDVTLSPDNTFYISDFGKDRIIKFDQAGNKIGYFGGFGYKKGKFSGPEGLFCDNFGNIFVVDSGNSRVQKFSPKGKFLLEFGKKGSGRGQLFRPADVAVSRDGRIYVSDCGNSRIVLFDESGNYIKSIGKSKLTEPRGLSFFKDGRLIIADGQRGVIIYDPKDSSWRRLDSLTGKVNRAVGVAVDKNSLLYVTDFGSYKVNVFIPERLKYVNLDVRAVRTLEFKFPYVQQYVMVHDRDGRSITGLTKDNFNVYERGVSVRPINLKPTYNKKKYLSTVFLIDKSESMKKHQTSLQRIMKGILHKLKNTDKIEVINFNTKAWISQKYISNILSPLEGAKKGKYSNRGVIGRALYKGVTRLFKYDYRPALILFTTAGFIEDDYAPYGYMTCLHYAKNNGIPIYVILFDHGKDTARLQQLAESTGGKVFDALTSNTVTDIRQIIMKKPLAFYSILYRTIAHPKMRGTFREFNVEVSYKGLFGYDKFGYYIPK